MGALHEAAEGLLAEFYRRVQADGGGRGEGRIEFVEGDVLTVDWADADVVLAASTCFGEELMKGIEEKARRTLKRGSILITFTKQLSSPSFELLLTLSRVKANWGGSVTIFIHRKS